MKSRGRLAMAEVLKLDMRVVARPCHAVPFQHVFTHAEKAFFPSLLNVKLAECSTPSTGSVGSRPRIIPREVSKVREKNFKKFYENFVFFSKVCNKSTEFLHDKYHSLFHTFEIRHSLPQGTTVPETKGHELEHVLII